MKGILIILLVTVNQCSTVKYNAKKEVAKRVTNLKRICDKYHDNPKFSELFEDVKDPVNVNDVASEEAADHSKG